MKRLRWSITLWLVSVLVTGCATVPRKGTQDVALRDLCEHYGLTWYWDNISQTVTISYGQKTAKALIGSEVVVIGQDDIILSAPVQRDRDRVMVPLDFKAKVINILRAGLPPKERRPLRIVIDAGHGGKDPGAVGYSGAHEKQIVLDVALRLQRLLMRKNFDVVLTRSRDEFLSLEKRTEISSRQRADIFVSIHANAHPSRRVSGIEVYSLRKLSWKEKREEQRRKNQQILYQKLAMRKGNAKLESVVADMLFSYKTAESDDLARSLSQELGHHLRARNLGVKKAGYFVLRNTLVPAALVEVGFLSNPREEKLLKGGAYRQRVAEALAEGLAAYVRRR